MASHPNLACPGQWWARDDFSLCVRQKYFDALVPTVIVAISAGWLLFRLTVAWSRSRNPRRQQRRVVVDRIGRYTDSTAELTNPERYVTEDEDEDLTLRTNTNTKSKLRRAKNSMVIENRPRGVLSCALIELAADLSLLALSVLSLLHFRSFDYPAKTDMAVIYAGQVVSVVLWGYLSALMAMRLLLNHRLSNTLRLWYNSISCYGILCVLSILRFRSALIHPLSDLHRKLMIAEFIVTFVMFGMLTLERKGNRVVYVEYDGKLAPSREQTASLFSLVTFTWVNALVVEGYRHPLNMSDIWALMPRDRAVNLLDQYYQVKKTTTLAYHLLSYFKWRLVGQACWSVSYGVLIFVPTMLLQALLRYFENPSHYPSSVPWLYISLFFVAGMSGSVVDSQALWIGRRISAHLRAIIIGEIYRKALLRRATIERQGSLGVDKSVVEQVIAEGIRNEASSKEEPRWKSTLKTIFCCSRRRRGIQLPDTETASAPSSTSTAEPAPKGADSKDSGETGEVDQAAASSGAIINLMSVDSFKVGNICAYLHLVWGSTPVQVITAIFMLYRVLGWSSIAGIFIMVLLLPANMIISRKFSAIQTEILKATDERIHVSNEVFNSIRIIKYFAWESFFQKKIEEKRSAELQNLLRKYWWWSAAVGLWTGSSIIITFFSFFCYSVIEGKPLMPSIAFTAVSLFQILRIPLDQFAGMLANVLEAKVSVDRVQQFLDQPNTEKYEQLVHKEIDGDIRALTGFRTATFTWGSCKTPDESTSSEGGSAALVPAVTDAFQLFDIDLVFPPEGLNVVVGPTGSGKSSLLMALLGEMSLMAGDVYLPGAGQSREEAVKDPATGLSESVAFCAQQAWLINNTIKQNILFAADYNEARYKEVIEACSLQRDFEILDNGDQTLVGEKGVALSGGQKQRISLARALYSSSRVVLLDDVLSAVDSHTAKWIFEKALLGPLMTGRLCVLVTHNVSLCVPYADFGVVMEAGRIVVSGDVDKLIASGKLAEDVVKSTPASQLPSRMPSRVQSQTVLAGTQELVLSQPAEDLTSDDDVHAEAKREGSIRFSVMTFYLKSMGGWRFWLIGMLGFIAQESLSVTLNFWIRRFSNSYVDAQPSALAEKVTYLTTPVVKSLFPASWPSQMVTRLSSTFDVALNTAKDVDASWYVTVYGCIGLCYIFIAVFKEYVIFVGSVNASRRIHVKLVEAVSRAKFRFFDSTPLGQIMNRFSKDVETIDQEVASTAIGVAYCSISIVTIVGLISFVTPMFLIAAVVITFLYYLIAAFYIHSSRDLKRIESVQRSPLFQQFGETLSGMVTIRAYGESQRFIDENMEKIDNSNRPYVYLWATNRWLSVRVDLVGSLVSLCTGVAIILGIGRIDAGAAGLAMTYAISFNDSMLWLVRLYATNEQNMNSVERVQEYLELPQEAPAKVEATTPPPEWPSEGAVEFFDFTTRYRDDLEPVLRNLSMKINPGEKVGIVGRTGAGKSSLALALFRALEAETGRIVVDDIDIGLIGLSDLRSRIVMVPQDPTLFSGTIRSNLDPFRQVEADERLFQALVDVKLIDEIPAASDGSRTPQASSSTDSDEESLTARAENVNVFTNLESNVAESGSNLSQGQRQLLCLARAILRKPKILLMDEATASIDYATDSRIQETIRKMRNTIITIAHRLQTIVDYDKIVVLDQGRVVECDHPHKLLAIDGGVFRKMCEDSGELESLETEAEKAWKAAHA